MVKKVREGGEEHRERAEVKMDVDMVRPWGQGTEAGTEGRGSFQSRPGCRECD